MATHYYYGPRTRFAPGNVIKRAHTKWRFKIMKITLLLLSSVCLFFAIESFLTENPKILSETDNTVTVERHNTLFMRLFIVPFGHDADTITANKTVEYYNAYVKKVEIRRNSNYSFLALTVKANGDDNGKMIYLSSDVKIAERLEREKTCKIRVTSCQYMETTYTIIWNK